jgi:hypothetical protein
MYGAYPANFHPSTFLPHRDAMPAGLRAALAIRLTGPFPASDATTPRLGVKSATCGSPTPCHETAHEQPPPNLTFTDQLSMPASCALISPPRPTSDFPMQPEVFDSPHHHTAPASAVNRHQRHAYSVRTQGFLSALQLSRSSTPLSHAFIQHYS